MLWQRILIGIVGAVFFSGMFSILAHQTLVEKFGKQVGGYKNGKVTFRDYLVDQKARKRIRWGTLIFFLVVAVLVFVFLWNTFLTPEDFRKFFPNL